MLRADYYRQQSDLCLRLSLMSEDAQIGQLLLNKALELRSEAEAVESPVGRIRASRRWGHPISDTPM
ncbi:MAG TPA: hypothetical protein VGH49_08435 [Xanthobacteraceae bacterium]